MKVFKVTLCIIDFDEIGAKQIKTVLEGARYPNRCIMPDVMAIEEADIGEWDDATNPLNNEDTANAEFNRIFKVG